MKVETEEQMSKRHLREQKELVHLEKEATKSVRFLKYIWLIVLILTIVYIADELASNMCDKVKPFMIFDMINSKTFSTADPEYEAMLSKMAIATIPTYIITFLLPLYKMLPDRFGRKIFLVLNTVGMGVGMAICMMSNTIYGYIIGTCITGFFTPNDIQVIYIMEVAPQKHRAKLCSITKGIALLSVSFIGLFKSIFYNQSDLGSWRMIFLIPVIIAVVIGLSCIILTRETPAYVKQRMEYLKMSDEERKAKEEAKKTKDNSTGLVAAWKYIAKSKQLKWVLISMCLFELAVGFKGYEYETLNAFNQSEEAYNLFLVIEPIVYAIYAFFSGFISDWLGRKGSCLVFAISAIIGELSFILLARNTANIILISIANGIFYGGLWSFSDCLFFVIPAESTPTHIRSSVTGLITYTAGLNMAVGMVLGICFKLIGSTNFSLLQLFAFVPTLIIATLVFAFKVKETKNVNIANVEEENI